MLERVVLLRPAAGSSTALAELQVLGRCLFVSDENNASASTSRVTEKQLAVLKRRPTGTTVCL